jgi:uncharacterized protein YbjT (DUF2867 family)
MSRIRPVVTSTEAVTSRRRRRRRAGHITVSSNPIIAGAGMSAGARNLLAAAQQAGVRHHVLLSIVGIHRIKGNAHYAGKREQERLVEAGRVPWTIVPATQFHDFAAMVTS